MQIQLTRFVPLHDQANLKHSRSGYKDNTEFRLKEDESAFRIWIVVSGNSIVIHLS